MANISRDSYDESKNYDKVILQQGVPIPDYDFNEAQDILRGRLKSVVDELIGNGAVDDGLKIVESAVSNVNNFTITAGTVYKSGYRVYFSNNQESSNLGITLTTPAASRDDLVYLNIYEVEISKADDLNIVHPDLDAAGIEPSRRIKIRGDIKVQEGNTTLPTDTSTHKYVKLAILHRTTSSNITSAMIEDVRPKAGISPKFDITLGHDHDGINSKKVNSRYIIFDDPNNHFMATEVESALEELYNIGSQNTATIDNLDFYTTTEVDNLLSGKSDTSHTHDTRYYTETEVDNLLAGKSDITHTHDFYSTSTADNRFLMNLEADTINNKIVAKDALGNVHNSITVPYATNTGTATNAEKVRGKNLWVQSSAPTAETEGDIWIEI